MKHLFMRLLFLSLVMFEAGNVGAETKWVKTDPADLADGDVVVIYDMYDGYAMKNDGETSTPKPLKVTLSTDKTQLKYEPAANILWTVKRSGDTYQFYASKETWLYCNKSDNGLNVGTNDKNNTFGINKDLNGKQWLYNINQLRYVVLYQSGSTIDWRSYDNTTDDKYKNTTIAFFKKVSDVNLSISDVGYATLYYGDRALVVPTGMTATTYSVSGNTLAESKIFEAGATIPAGEAVVLKAPKGNYNFAVSTASATKDERNSLRGSDQVQETTGGTLYYALTLNKQNDPKSVGFYWMNETGTAFTNGAHKAYLALGGSLGGGAQAKSSYLFSEATTGIKGAETVAHDAFREGFNLNGQRVNQGYRGIVIVNGRKYIAK